MANRTSIEFSDAHAGGCGFRVFNKKTGQWGTASVQINSTGEDCARGFERALRATGPPDADIFRFGKFVFYPGDIYTIIEQEGDGCKYVPKVPEVEVKIETFDVYANNSASFGNDVTVTKTFTIPEGCNYRKHRLHVSSSNPNKGSTELSDSTDKWHYETTTQRDQFNRVQSVIATCTAKSKDSFGPNVNIGIQVEVVFYQYN